MPFVRKSKNQQLPPGTKSSIHNSQLLVSSGLFDVDSLIGGGIALGSMVCGLQDKYSHYLDQTMCRYFLGEGMKHKHICIRIGRERGWEHGKLKDFLPFNYSVYQSQQVQSVTLEEKIKEKQSELKIAWQYKDYVTDQMHRRKQQKPMHPALKKKTAMGTVSCSQYDLSKSIQDDLYDEDCAVELVADELDKVLKRIRELLVEHRDCVCRIVIHSLGGLQYDAPSFSKVYRFVHSLKQLVKSSLSTCLITLPARNFSPNECLSLQQQCDYVFEMDSFSAKGVSLKEFQDYTGFFTIVKLPRINSLCLSHPMDTLQYGFKLKRRKLYVEKFNFPPEETRSAADPNRKRYQSQQGMSCSSTGGAGSSDLDF